MPGAVAGYDCVMDDMIYLKVFAVAAVIFGLAGFLAGNPVYLAIAALAVSNLIGSFLMGGEQLGRHRRPSGRTGSGSDHPRS